MTAVISPTACGRCGCDPCSRVTRHGDDARCTCTGSCYTTPEPLPRRIVTTVEEWLHARRWSW